MAEERAVTKYVRPVETPRRINLQMKIILSTNNCCLYTPLYFQLTQV